jgi:hypothetical protein
MGGAVAGAGLEQVGDHDAVGQHVLVGGPVHGRQQRRGLQTSCSRNNCPESSNGIISEPAG